MTAESLALRWRPAKLEELVFFQRGFDITQAQQRPGAFPVISSSGITSYHDEAMVHGPGIVIGRKGTLGSIHYTPGDYWPHDTTLWSKDLRGNVPRFVYYYLHTLNFKRFDVGNSNPTLNRNHIHDLAIKLPPREIQERIASILSAYDDAIENNRRRMGLLEKAARLLYEEWFVRLRFPGHKHTPITNGLPQGWEPLTLSELIDVEHGYAFDGEHFSDEPTSRVLLTPGSFRIGGGFKLDRPKFYEEDGPLESEYVLPAMELVVTMTDLSVMSDTLGYPAFVPTLDGVTFLHNQRVGRVVPKGKWFPKHFLFHSMCDRRYRQHVLGSATGTSVKHSAPKRIVSYSLAVPKNRTMIERFENGVRPLHQQLATLLELNQKLRAARDLLLPRLMSGEIEV